MAPQLITELFLFVGVDPQGNEGIVSIASEGGLLPLLGCDQERIDSWRPIAQDLARQHGVELKLYHFRGPGELVELIDTKGEIHPNWTRQLFSGEAS